MIGACLLMFNQLSLVMWFPVWRFPITHLFCLSILSLP